MPQSASQDAQKATCMNLVPISSPSPTSTYEYVLITSPQMEASEDIIDDEKDSNPFSQLSPGLSSLYNQSAGGCQTTPVREIEKQEVAPKKKASGKFCRTTSD